MKWARVDGSPMLHAFECTGVVSISTSRAPCGTKIYKSACGVHVMHAEHLRHESPFGKACQRCMKVRHG